MTRGLGDILPMASIKGMMDSGLWSRLDRGSGRMRPRMVVCETLNVCNSDCVFCPYSMQARPKGLMPMARFRQVLDQYAAMGGGPLSLTPMVGDVLLDPHLVERLEAARAYGAAFSPSVTTNLFALGRLDDARLDRVLGLLDRMQVSIYGMTAEESAQLTRRGLFEDFCANLRRLADRLAAHPAPPAVHVAVRATGPRTHADVDAFLLAHAGRTFPIESLIWEYRNWGGRMGGPLPGAATFTPTPSHKGACALPAVAMQVFWDGRVSACACCDFDACGDLALGHMDEAPLEELFNGPRSQRLWQRHVSGDLPDVCKGCTFHVPLSPMAPQHPIVAHVQQFVGG